MNEEGKNGEEIVIVQDPKESAALCVDRDVLQIDAERLSEEEQSKKNVANDFPLKKKRCALEEERALQIAPHSPEIPKVRKTDTVSPSNPAQAQVAADCPAYRYQPCGTFLAPYISPPLLSTLDYIPLRETR